MMTGSQLKTGCIACSRKLLHFGRRLAYRYMICADCGTIQLSPVPTSEELAAAYRDEYARADHIARDPRLSRKATATLHAALVNTLKHHGATGRVLDYGCGWGGLVLRLRESGFDAVGYDLSEEMVKFCREDGLPVKRGGIESVEERDLDAIVLASVFEHLNDPAAWLRHAAGITRAGGLLVSTQPTAPFARTVGDMARLRIRSLPLPGLHQIFCPPWHVALYSLEGMRRLVESADFEQIAIVPAPQQREPGLTGVVQWALETVNRLGWKLFGLRWPFFTGHIFVFRRR